jgi:hypothetical protein
LDDTRVSDSDFRTIIPSNLAVEDISGFNYKNKNSIEHEAHKFKRNDVDNDVRKAQVSKVQEDYDKWFDYV